MTTWAIIAAYAAGGFATGCRVTAFAAWFLLASYNRRYRSMSSTYPCLDAPGGEHWFFGSMYGVLAACVWPLVVVAAAGRSFLFAPPRDVQVARQKARIEELERGLDVGA
jgi:hypothetical protein